MRIYAYLSLLVLSILMVAFFFPLPTHAVPAWTIQTISTSAFSPKGIALDSNNYPHIAYTEWMPPINTDYSNRNGRDYVIYASWNGSMWINQTVAEDATFLDLVLDSHNNARILFKTISQSQLIYASWTGIGWNIQNVDREGFEGSLTLDLAGNPHIAYFTSGNATSPFFLKYASWNGSSWNSEIVDAGGMTYVPSLKFDPEDYPHIMYETDRFFTPTNSSQALKYATLDNASGWNVQTVGTNISFTNMVLDSKGYPHFTYGTTCVGWTGSTWNNQSFSSKFNSTMSYGNSYLALDKENNPHIDMEIFSSNGIFLTYIWWTGTDWDVQTVASSWLAGPIAIDSNGNPHICSGGGSVDPSNLMYATTTESTQTSTAPFSIGFLIAIPVIVVLSVIALVYNWKKKTKKIV